MIMPGVQYPHCRPCSVWNERCIGCQPSLDAPSPDASARPSTVRTSLPSACTARTVQLLAELPSRCTVHAPQLDVSQPMFVPVSPSTSRR